MDKSSRGFTWGLEVEIKGDFRPPHFWLWFPSCCPSPCSGMFPRWAQLVWSSMFLQAQCSWLAAAQVGLARRCLGSSELCIVLLRGNVCSCLAVGVHCCQFRIWTQSNKQAVCHDCPASALVMPDLLLLDAEHLRLQKLGPSLASNPIIPIWCEAWGLQCKRDVEHLEQVQRELQKLSEVWSTSPAKTG